MAVVNTAKELAISHGPPSTEDPVTLWNLLSRGVRRNPDGIAVNSVHQDIRLTFKDLNDDAEDIARAWHRRNVTGAVLVLLSNRAEFSTLLWAAARLGVEFSPVNPKSNHDLVRHYIKVLQPEVIVVEDQHVLDELESANVLPQTLKERFFVRPSQRSSTGVEHQSLRALVSEGSSSSESLPSPVTDARMPAIVIWTSGTTSLPKACPQTGETLSAALASSTAWRRPSTDRSMLCHIPAFHVFATIYVVLFWSVGGSVVYASPSFDPATSLKAMEGLVTDVVMIPAMYRMMTNHHDYDKAKIRNVRVVNLGGSMIPIQTIENVAEAFSATKAYAGYGMSEAMGTIGWHDTEDFTTDNGFVSVGKAGYGVHVKICNPRATNNDPLLRGETGELHVAGNSIIGAYGGGISSDSFYEDGDGQRWLKSGDQARMDDEGAIFILGRYKDMIIRGGENIAPAAIESVLNSFQGVESQVVGVPDDLLAGEEAPCAVLKVKDHAQLPSFGALQEAIRKKLGPMYLLSKVMTLQDIGLDDFPTTATNKVMKDELRQIVRDNESPASVSPPASEADTVVESSTTSGSSPSPKVESTVLGIWSDLLATPKQELDRGLAIEQLADSLTVSRFRGLVKRHLGKDVPEALLKCEGGIDQQIEVISERKASTASSWGAQTSRTGPPEVNEIVLARGSIDMYASIQEAVGELTAPLKMSWEDVEEILPVPPVSAYTLSKLSNHSVLLKNAIWADTTPAELRQAFEHLITEWSSTRLLFGRPSEGEPFYAQMKATSRWFDEILVELNRPVSDEKELKELTRNIEDIYVQPPGPLFKVLLIPVNSTTVSSAAIIIAQHAIFDAFTTSFWLEDLRALVQDPSYRSDRIPYKEFADMLYDTAGSARAAASIRFWQQQYTGISKFADCTWPPQRAPGFFIGPDDGSSEHEARGNLHLDNDRCLSGLDGIRTSVTLPGLTQLRHAHALHPVILIKSAYALFLASQIGKSAVAFGTVQGGRQWPFQPPSVEQTLPSPMSIAGPTFSFIVDIVKIDSSQTVLAFMKGLAAQQDLDVKHMHAPLPAVHGGLDAEDSRVLREVHRPSKFNWRPNLPSLEAEKKERLRVAVSDLFLNTATLFNFRQRDVEPETVYAQAQYDDCHVSKQEMERAVAEIFEIAEWLVKEENWERSLGACMQEVERSQQQTRTMDKKDAWVYASS